MILQMRSEIEEIEDLSYRSPYAYPLSHLEFSEYAESPVEPSHVLTLLPSQCFLESEAILKF